MKKDLLIVALGSVSASTVGHILETLENDGPRDLTVLVMNDPDFYTYPPPPEPPLLKDLTLKEPKRPQFWQDHRGHPNAPGKALAGGRNRIGRKFSARV